MFGRLGTPRRFFRGDMWLTSFRPRQAWPVQDKNGQAAREEAEISQHSLTRAMPNKTVKEIRQMKFHKNTFSIDQIQQLEIGSNGNIMPRIRDLDYDSTLRGSLLSVLYPGIKVASVLVPVEPLDEVQENRVRNTMAKFIYKGVRYCLVGAASSAKKGLFYFVDEQHHQKIAARFHNWPQAAISYFGILVSNCRVVADLPKARVLVVSDNYLGTNDCGGWIRKSIANKQLDLSSGTLSQFRIAFDQTQGKGSFKLMEDDVADLLDADVILPQSSVKPGLKLLEKVHKPFDHGSRFCGRTVIGIREVSRRLQFESSYTLTQHAPGESIMTEIIPRTKAQVDKVSHAVGAGRYEELLELIGHNLEKVVGPEDEVGTVEGLLLADTSGHIVKNPWVNAQLDKLLTRWTYKACTGGAFYLPAFALGHDGYLFASNGKVYHGSDWIPKDKSISALESNRGLCVRYPIRMYEDLLPLEHMSPADVIASWQTEIEKQGCENATALAEQVLHNQLFLDGTYILHSETAKRNGGDFDFDLVGVLEDTCFAAWVADRFAWTKQTPLTKTKASKEKHAWWNIVHVARRAVGNQIGSITDLITSCLADGRPELADDLVKELQNALDSLKHGVEPDQEKISAIRKEVTTAPWLRLKHERRVSDLPMHVDVKETDKIGILYNHIRPHFDELLTAAAPLEAFIGLMQGEQVTDQMIKECHYVHGAYGTVVASIGQKKAELKTALDKARKEWDAVHSNSDKNLRKEKLFAKVQAQAAYHHNEERAKDAMKAIVSFLKIWSQNKTTNRMAWAQALNGIVCKGKGKSTGSLIWLTFPQELVTRLAEITGGKNVRLYTSKMVEGWVRTDEHGRTFLVEVIDGGLKETFLFTFKDGKFTLEPKIAIDQPQQQQAESVPQATLQVDDPEGLGHEMVDEMVFGTECDVQSEHAPF